MNTRKKASIIPPTMRSVFAVFDIAIFMFITPNFF